jgi:hypothetical protein
VFSTVISLMIVPCSYIMMTDTRRALRRIFKLDRSHEQPMGEAAASGAGEA